MKRRIKIVCSLIAIGCIFFGAAKADDRAKESKPNVIFILVDDVGAAWLPPFAKQIDESQVEDEIINDYKKTFAKNGFDLTRHMEAARNSMPFLDKLSEQGTIFNMCFTSANLCAPSRAGILSASYQQRYGGYDNVDIHQVGITDSFPLLTNQFKENGYETAMIGKWHVGRHDDRLNPKGARIEKGKFTNEYGYQSSCAPGQNPLDHGFDYYFGYNNHTSLDYEADDLWEGYERVPQRPKGEFLTDLFNRKVEGFIEESLKEEKPFFVYYAPKTLHGRIDPPPSKYLSKFDTGVPFTNNYAGHLFALDEGIKQIYALLKEYQQDENTLFIIASDNGAPAPVPPYNAPFKGGKGTGWLGGSHTPMIIVWPGHTIHQITDELVSTMDILPTALDFAGIDFPESSDGRSLKSLLTGKTNKSPHEILFSSGLHSTRWSYPYIGEKNKRDSKDCPLFAWTIDQESVLLLLTETPKGLYNVLPDGLPERVVLSNWQEDPKQEINIEDNNEVQLKKKRIHNWLQDLAEPVLNHQADFQKLINLSGN